MTAAKPDLNSPLGFMNSMKQMGLQILIMVLLVPALSWGQQEEDSHAIRKWQERIAVEWSGHLRTLGLVSGSNVDSLQFEGERGLLLDGSTEIRLENRIFFGQDLSLTTHYLLGSVYGERFSNAQDVSSELPPGLGDSLPFQTLQEDRTQLFDLSRVFSRETAGASWHRLDRLLLTLDKPWGSLKIGRQALTWGNGLVFHPFDLFNPFAPGAVLTDYKPGQDMASLLFPLGLSSEIHMLAVPRRNSDNDRIEWDQSSVAGKVHHFAESCELDILAAYHYGDRVFGFGGRGSLSSAAWRFDLTWTDPEAHEDYLTLAANCDRSWVWAGKNAYGFVEVSLNGLGSDDPGQALQNPELAERIGRGDLFLTGRAYLASGLELEVHPLCRVQANLILNAEDGSGLLQPRLTWDVTTNLELILGASLYFGKYNSEFGGFAVRTPAGDSVLEEPNSAYLWLTRYF